LAGVLMDVQTSGGLLLSVLPERCAVLIAELGAAGAICAAIVGHVRRSEGARIWLTE